MSDIVSQANELVRRGDVHGAVALLHRAEQAGNGQAARELAIWCLSGQLVGRDLATSRALFERAAALGDEPSAAVARAFIAGGIGGPPDWSRALRMLRDAAPNDAHAAKQLRVIEAMKLTEAGEPSDAFPSEVLSDSPDVRLFPRLLTADECRFLIEAALPALQPSTVVDPATGALVANPVRTSDAAAFPFVDENPAIHALNRRLAKASGADVKSGEPLQVLRYAPGQEYRPHFDAIGTTDNQRVLTFLVYLNDDFEGGETQFLASGLSIKGRAGDGLLFRNADRSGLPDPRSQHAGKPVTRGVKFLASRWIRQRPLVS
jgi:prolyl 4-hydroxylase